MTKYHINSETGNVGRCSAVAGKCPFGSEAQHYGSEAEARKAYEAQNAGNSLPTVKKFGVRLERRAEKHVVPKTLEALPSKPTDDELKNASAYSVVNNRYAAAAYSNTVDPNKEFKDLSVYDGADYLDLGAKGYIITNPEGGFIKVSFRGGIDAQHDGAWEYTPELNAQYEYYKDFDSLKAGKPEGVAQHIEVDTDSIFREKLYGGGDQLSYDHYSSRSARTAAISALNSLPNPYDIAKLAHLNHYEGKLAKDVLQGPGYLGNPNKHVRAAVAQRKELPVESHEKLLSDKSSDVKIALAGRQDLSKETMEKLLAMEDRWKDGNGDGRTPRGALLKNPKLPVRLMNKIANEGSIEDMRNLYYNPAISEKNKEKILAASRQLGFRIYKIW